MAERIKKEIIKLKTIFTNKPADEKWIYILQAYSLYLALIIFIFSLLEGLVAGYALLIFAIAMFLVISFYTSYTLKEFAGSKIPGLSLAVYGFAILIPMAFVVSGATFVLVAIFASLFVAAIAAARVENIEVKKIKEPINKTYAIAKTAYAGAKSALYAAKAKTKRRKGELHYTVREVGSTSEKIPEQ